MEYKNVSVRMNYSGGVNTNLENLGRYYVLAQAITTNRYDTIESLINHDTNVGRLKFYRKHVLNWVNESTDIEIIKLLANNTRIVMKKNHSPLMISAVLRYTEVVQILIDRGADVNWDDGSSSPLEKACVLGYEDSAKLLLANGAVVNKPYETGKNVLYEACKYNKNMLATDRILVRYNDILQFVMFGRK